MEQLVARWAHNPKAVGSSPTPATKNEVPDLVSGIFVCSNRKDRSLFDNVSIEFDHLIYFSDVYPRDFPGVRFFRTEQKIFFQIFLEEFKFRR